MASVVEQTRSANKDHLELTKSHNEERGATSHGVHYILGKIEATTLP